jgi:thioredoxin reductase (NADPH)
VSYKLIDAEAYAGRRVLVVGGGDSAVEAAMGLAHQEGCQVTMSYRKPDLMRIKQRNSERIAPLISAGKIDFRGATTVSCIREGEVELKGDDGVATVANDDVIILAGGIPPFALLRKMGVRFGGEQQSMVVQGA